MRTFSLLLALALSACASQPQIRVTTVYCLSQAQLDQLKAQEPPRVKRQLTGDAAKDVGILAGSAIRLRAYSEGLLGVLGGCVQPTEATH